MSPGRHVPGKACNTNETVTVNESHRELKNVDVTSDLRWVRPSVRLGARYKPRRKKNKNGQKTDEKKRLFHEYL